MLRCTAPPSHFNFPVPQFIAKSEAPFPSGTEISLTSTFLDVPAWQTKEGQPAMENLLPFESRRRYRRPRLRRELFQATDILPLQLFTFEGRRSLGRAEKIFSVL